MARSIGRKQLVDRWKTQDGTEKRNAVLQALAHNGDLSRLGLEMHEGRYDLRGLSVPEARLQESARIGAFDVRILKGLTEFHDIQLQSLDLSYSALKHIRMFSCRITDCKFDHADCTDWRFWGVQVEKSSFRYANLRTASLAGWHQGRGCSFTDVSFEGADFRRNACGQATFIDCDFSHARLEKVEFGISSFIRCRFAGELREVIFYGSPARTTYEKNDPNPMQDVDFSQARLRWVEFRNLNLDRVKFPEDSEHLLIRNLRFVLERGLQQSREPGHQFAKLKKMLELDLKWMGPQQQIGIFSIADIADWAGGEEQGEAAVEWLRSLEQECTRPN